MKRLIPFALLLLIGCDSVHKITGAESTSKPDVGTVYEFHTVACCTDTFNGQTFYPPFVPLAHAQFCQRVRAANRRDELIDGAIYLAMSVDCGHGHGRIGDEYYPPSGY